VSPTAHHLVDDAPGHVVEGEAAGFLGHARMEHHLEQEIAELVLQRGHVVALDGLGHLVGFLDGVGRDGAEALLDVPGAAARRIAQPRHDAQEVFDGGGLRRCFFWRAHGRGRLRKAAKGEKGVKRTAPGDN
jgi:hypothetical protein